MILIISSNSDQTTLQVIEYLEKWKYNYLFLHETNRVTGITIEFPTVCLTINKKQNVELSCIKSFWYRRVDIHCDFDSTRKEKLHPAIADYLYEEWNILKGYLYTILSKKRTLGSFHTVHNVNKLSNLLHAKEQGLKVPKTLITSSKKELLRFYEENKHRGIITKNISENFGTRVDDNLVYQMGTTLVERYHIESLSENIYPILVQENIKKAYELRVFFLQEKFYSMAIFSQGNTKTETDFRNYDQEKPNRMVPYILPHVIKQKLRAYIKDIGLDTGSIDMIVSLDGGYYFLEVNPIGQFGWLSSVCNYNLEKKVAQYLAYE